MKISFLNIALSGAILCGAFASPVQARDFDGVWDKDRWQFRLRAIGVLPDAGGSTTIGGKLDADDAYVPEFDITYFFTKHIAAELILATSSHDVSLKTAGGELDLGDTMLLPPTLTLQYHFSPDQAFSPYIGAGVTYALPYAEDNGRNSTKLAADGSFGAAVQAGFDYWLNDNWGVNFDVKKIWVDVDASVNYGTITGELELNPWVIGTGVSYRF